MERPAPLNPNPPPGAPPGTSPEPPPRAFAQGTGVMLQTFGMLLFLGACCTCSFSGWWYPVADRGTIIEQLRTGDSPVATLLSSPGEAGFALMALFTTAGGLAMAVFGLGLQAERRRAGLAAFVTTAALLFVLLVSGVLIWIGPSTLLLKAVHAAVTLVVAILAGFAWVALQQVRANPPPADIEIVKPGTKIPYSFYHDDPPEVRLARDLAARREKLEAEQRELQRLEDELKQRDEK